MNVYPFNSPIIMDESIYIEYGGQSGSASATQLSSSFLIAEQKVSKYIGTLLLPTIVTGTYPYNRHNFIATDYGYVHRVPSAKIFSTTPLSKTCTLKEDSGCVYIFEDTYGYLDFSCINSICNCSGWKSPYQYQIVYEAGLPTGTANQPGILHALTIVSELSLQEMLYPRANESQGDRGILEWSSLNYKEKRKDWPKTVLGQSARAGLAADLIKSSVKLARRAIMMR